MRLIGLAVILTLSLFAAPLAADAQPARKVPRIGVLLGTSQSFESTRVEALRQGLRERGYVEGQNIIIEYRYGDGKLDQLPKLAAELVGLNVDLIVTGGTQPTRAAQQASRTIPIVMTIVGDPIASGFIASLAKPGGTITGLTQISVELSGKRLELLKEAFPKVSRVAVLVDPATSAQGAIGVLQPTRVAAAALGVKLLTLELRGPNSDLEGAFRTATNERVGALLVAPGPALDPNSKRIVDLAARSRLAAIERVCGPRWTHVVCSELSRFISPGRDPCGQDPQRGQAGRLARRAAHHVRAGDQPQDRESARAHDPALGARAGGSGDRVARARAIVPPGYCDRR